MWKSIPAINTCIYIVSHIGDIIVKYASFLVFKLIMFGSIVLCQHFYII